MSNLPLKPSQHQIEAACSVARQRTQTTDSKRSNCSTCRGQVVDSPFRGTSKQYSNWFVLRPASTFGLQNKLERKL